MSRDHDPFSLAIEAWLDSTDDHEDPETVMDRVIARLEGMPQGRAWWPNGRPEFMNRAIGTAVAAAAVVVVALIGYQSFVAPNVGGPGPPASSTPSSPFPTPEPRWTPPPYQVVGFIGLPPLGSTPSTPERGELVDSYLTHGGQLPFRGMARLYADGRLIWYRFLGGSSTGYLEQRLTPEGVELVRAHDNLAEKDPVRLPEWLPPSAWEDQTIRAYVPPAFAACLQLFDPAAPVEERVYPNPDPPMERSEMLSLLPATAADLLRDRETLLPADDAHDCLVLTTADARQLDTALTAAGLEQDARQNKYVLEYYLDAPGPGTEVIVITFEPIFPDGTSGCSACG